MAEIVEYLLAFAISGLVASMSIFLVHGSFPVLDRVGADSQSSEIINAAQSSIAEGSNKTVVAMLTNATISCSDSRLTVSIGGIVSSSDIPLDCEFSFAGVEGLHTLTFVPTETTMSLSLT